MMNKREYYRQWRNVPRASAPPDLGTQVIQKSGILNHASASRKLNKTAYILANLAVILGIILLIGFDLHKADQQCQERLNSNVINLAEKASLNLQPILMEQERNDAR